MQNSRLNALPRPALSSPKASTRLPSAILLLVLATQTLSATQAQSPSQSASKATPSTALFQQANDALATGDFTAALRLLTSLNAQTPNNPQILYDLGLTAESLTPETATPQPSTQAPTAESFYRQSIAANPLFPASHVALGLLLARTDRATEAHAELVTATSLADTEPALKARAFRALARLDQQSKPPNLAGASSNLLAALNLTPEEPDDILLAAEIAEATPDLPAAEQAYRRSLALTPQDPTATASLAHILLAEHHAAEAEALLAPTIAAHPADPTLTSQLAAAYLASNDPAKIALAAPLLEALHTAKPQDANIARLLARVYLDTGHPDQADPLYAALIAAQSNHPDPTLLDERAEALLRLHRPGAAETLLKQAVADPAGFPTPAALGEAATHLAFAASEIDDPKITLQALLLRSSVLPPSADVLFLQATANDTLHESRKAADLYKQFLAAANGSFPEQEAQARQRLAALEHRK